MKFWEEVQGETEGGSVSLVIRTRKFIVLIFGKIRQLGGSRFSAIMGCLDFKFPFQLFLVYMPHLVQP